MWQLKTLFFALGMVSTAMDYQTSHLTMSQSSYTFKLFLTHSVYLHIWN